MLLEKVGDRPIEPLKSRCILGGYGEWEDEERRADGYTGVDGDGDKNGFAGIIIRVGEKDRSGQVDVKADASEYAGKEIWAWALPSLDEQEKASTESDEYTSDDAGPCFDVLPVDNVEEGRGIIDLVSS